MCPYTSILDFNRKKRVGVKETSMPVTKLEIELNKRERLKLKNKFFSGVPRNPSVHT